MTNEAKELFLADRVKALATVIMTRRDDLTITETKKSTGLDFHVYIDREDKPMRLAFGVLLRGVTSPMTAENVNKVLGPTIGQFQGMRKFTYPVCLFFFLHARRAGLFLVACRAGSDRWRTKAHSPRQSQLRGADR
jgi:hypothetical protein